MSTSAGSNALEATVGAGTGAPVSPSARGATVGVGSGAGATADGEGSGRSTGAACGSSGSSPPPHADTSTTPAPRAAIAATSQRRARIMPLSIVNVLDIITSATINDMRSGLAPRVSALTLSPRRPSPRRAGWPPAAPDCYAAQVTAALGLYLHIPFCTSKCGYCDFNSYEGLDHLVPGYTRALLSELELWAPAARGSRVQTVFFGGGTPSLTSLDDMRAIAGAVRAHYDVAAGAEWTLEANPDELTVEHLTGLRGLGFNRLSIGVQSLHDDELRLLDRAHSAERAVEAVRAARAAGFDSLNLDFIFGLIGQPLARWRQTLERALELRPEHLSCYALTVEPGTALYYRVEKGDLPAPDPDVAATQYEWTRERLADAGYRHYEISNWAQPERECRHNLVYWRAEPYLGMGAGAHSLFAGQRFANVDAPNRYIEAVEASYEERRASGHGAMRQIAGGETPDQATLRSDAMILGLRLLEGVSNASFAERFGCTPEDAFGEAIARHRALGLLEREDGRLRLTGRGLLLANEVFVDLLPDDVADRSEVTAGR